MEWALFILEIVMLIKEKMDLVNDICNKVQNAGIVKEDVGIVVSILMSIAFSDKDKKVVVMEDKSRMLEFFQSIFPSDHGIWNHIIIKE